MMFGRSFRGTGAFLLAGVLWPGVGSTAEAAFTAFNDVVAHSAGGH